MGCLLCTPPTSSPLPSTRLALLPELGDRRGEVAGTQRDPQALVLAHSVFHTLGCVPAVVAVCPGQLRLEGLEQVVSGPGQDDDIVDVQEGHDHNGGIADACGCGQAKGASGGRPDPLWPHTQPQYP